MTRLLCRLSTSREEGGFKWVCLEVRFSSDKRQASLSSRKRRAYGVQGLRLDPRGGQRLLLGSLLTLPAYFRVGPEETGTVNDLKELGERRGWRPPTVGMGCRPCWSCWACKGPPSASLSLGKRDYRGHLPSWYNR